MEISVQYLVGEGTTGLHKQGGELKRGGTEEKYEAVSVCPSELSSLRAKFLLGCACSCQVSWPSPLGCGRYPGSRGLCITTNPHIYTEWLPGCDVTDLTDIWGFSYTD